MLTKFFSEKCDLNFTKHLENLKNEDTDHYLQRNHTHGDYDRRTMNEEQKRTGESIEEEGRSFVITLSLWNWKPRGIQLRPNCGSLSQPIM